MIELLENLPDTHGTVTDKIKSVFDNREGFYSELLEGMHFSCTGINSVDTFTGGGVSGFVILGGEPGCGKTPFALQIGIKNAIQHNKPFVVCTWEMNPKHLFLRVLQTQIKFGSDYLDFKKAVQTFDTIKPELERQISTNPDLNRLLKNTYIFGLGSGALCDENKEIDFDKLSGVLGALEEKHGQKPLLIVDSLHVTPAKYNLADKQRLDYLTTKYREVTDITGCTTVCISHLNRAGRSDGKMDSFSGSGGIEYNADMCLILGLDEKVEGGRVVKVVKDRFGGKGDFDVNFDWKNMTFTDIQ